MNAAERWLPIPGYEGLYEVSDHGRVRSLDRPGHRRGKMLTLSRTRSGHVALKLYRDGVAAQKFVHRAVLEAFVGPAPEGTEGCHWDGNSANNRLENLRWDTRSANALDGVRNGVHRSARRTHCPRGHELVAPNLVLAVARKGWRACLSCGRARTFCRHHGIEFTSEWADREYERVMGVRS